MTIAVLVKVYDGIILAADSASTLSLSDGSSQVYNNANKIFHLHRHKPIAAMTWGLGNIGAASIGTLAKDARRAFMGLDTQRTDWQIEDEYTIEEIATRLAAHFDSLYAGQMAALGGEPPGLFGLLVAGYSSAEAQAEAWEISIDGQSSPSTPVQRVPADGIGWLSFAQPEATSRLYLGVDPALNAQIEEALEPHEWAKVSHLFPKAHRFPAVAPMPLGDAIQLARFLVDVTVGYTRFSLGPDTVGGPVEIASMSRHEGFRWIARKHYYSQELNPKEPGHDY